MKNLCFLVAPFPKNKLVTFGIFNESIFGQKFIIFEKLRYMVQLLLKLQVVEVVTSVH